MRVPPGTSTARRAAVGLGMGLLLAAAPAAPVPRGARPGPAPPPITALGFSVDGRFLVRAGGRRVEVMASDGSGRVRTLPTQIGRVHDLAFRPDGRLLAVAGGRAGESGAVELLTWPEGRPAGILTGHRDLVMAAAFRPDGAELVTAGADRQVLLHALSPAPAAPPRILSGHTGPVLAAAYSPDGGLLVTAGGDASLRVWGAAGKLVRVLNFHTAGVQCLAFRPPLPGRAVSPYCATGGEDRTARVWQPGLGRMVRILREASGPVLSVTYTRDGAELLAAAADGKVRRYDGDSDELLGTWQAHPGWVGCLAVSPDGKHLATGAADGRVRLWNLPSGTPAVSPFEKSVWLPPPFRAAFREWPPATGG